MTANRPKYFVFGNGLIPKRFWDIKAAYDGDQYKMYQNQRGLERTLTATEQARFRHGHDNCLGDVLDVFKGEPDEKT